MFDAADAEAAVVNNVAAAQVAGTGESGKSGESLRAPARADWYTGHGCRGVCRRGSGSPDGITSVRWTFTCPHYQRRNRCRQLGALSPVTAERHALRLRDWQAG